VSRARIASGVSSLWLVSSLLGCGGSGGGGGGGNNIMTGPPITAANLTWTWVDFPESKCRDGTPTGLAVNLNSASDKVMVFLQGGGACFNQLTCAMNPSHADASSFVAPTEGVFSRSNTANPVADWNFVYVPFCTGDVFGGNHADAMVSGVTGAQQFVGWTNVGLFLQRIVPTFPHATQVLFTGISAGGFGAALNGVRVAQAFAPIPVVVLDDSGPPMSSTYVPTCLQKQWRELWGFDQTVLAACGSDCPNPDDYSLDLARWAIKKQPNGTAGLISAQSDNTITAFYGFGQADCTAGFNPLPSDQFTAGLNEFRTTVTALTPHFGTYYIASTTHTWIARDVTFGTTVAGVALSQWIADLLAGTVAQVSPP
jgi:hypothetical protein